MQVLSEHVNIRMEFKPPVLRYLNMWGPQVLQFQIKQSPTIEQK